MKVVIKAVHLYSREYDVIRHLSSPTLRSHPMNHCIREYPHLPEINKLLMPDLAVLDLIEVPRDNLAFIVMKEWSAQLVADTPCNLGLCLSALRQCIEVGRTATVVCSTQIS